MADLVLSVTSITFYDFQSIPYCYCLTPFFLSPNLIASTGHISLHAPQLVQLVSAGRVSNSHTSRHLSQSLQAFALKYLRKEKRFSISKIPPVGQR